ncbi:TerC/Alx family metal homeostasis membrane protein [Myroides ceti]|uniref:TerC/Alx family metal homeostasis membrane protein n=1 Tax=Paenimyroides ceti TaxID=395087 RepID=A0ABT8D0E9_9FLAO|nr:TerC/Alx family metal homeostasis membrane protein [Paenimyroides ceti]MDN3708699.1 TerC/Alx family metal homeostasis membrane protein [Paenimyroides ceti]
MGHADHLINHPGLIIGFGVAVIIMLLLDLGVFNKNSHEVSNKEALIWSLVWIFLSMVFSGVVYYVLDKPQGITDNFSKYQAAYWIEKALSVDNLFVFILVFRFFKIPKKYQHKVLFWGILGALAFRAIFIFAGVELIKLTYVHIPFGEHPLEVNVVLTIFGLFLLVAGFKSWFSSNDDSESDNMSKNIGVRLVHRFFKVSNDFDGDKFFTVQKGVKMVTPLFVALAVIEITDLVFAVDSIPAIFAIAPDDPFILYTSNIFAILGLRSLYFLLANSMDMFSKLHYGLAVILVFIGVKMLIMPFYHFDSMVSLAIIGSVLILSVAASLLFPVKHKTS